MLHQLPGRFRAKHNRLYDKRLSQYINVYCDGLFGVTCCNANSRTATVLVVYDEKKTTADLLLQKIDAAIEIGAEKDRDWLDVFGHMLTAENRRDGARRKLFFYGLFYIALRTKQALFGKAPFSGGLRLLQAASVVTVTGGYPLLKNAYRALARPLPADPDKLLWAASQFFTFTRGSAKGVFLLWLKELSDYVKFSADADCFRILGQNLNKTFGLAVRITPDGKGFIPADRLDIGDVIEVGKGELVPARGVVAQGAAQVDGLYYAGHPMVRRCTPGQEVHEGMAVLDGKLAVRVTQAQKQPPAPDIKEEDVAAYRNTKAYSYRLTAPALGLSLLNALTTRSFSGALGMMMTLSPSSANAAFGTGIKNYAALLNKNHLYLRNPYIIEKLAGIRHVVFDKTGTLTRPKMTLCETAVYDRRYSGAALLSICAACEAGHYHPAASALREAAGAPDDGGVTESCLIPSRGIRARYNGLDVLIGNRQLMLASAVDISEGESLYERLAADYTPVFMAVDGRLAAIFALKEALRDSAPALIQKLKRLGVEVTLVTGDTEQRAKIAAGALGIDAVFSACAAGEKADIVRRLRETGAVMMVGDGVNDREAMRAADVSVSFVDAACDKVKLQSDCVIFERDMDRLPDLLTLSNKAYRCIGQSIAVSKGMNVLLGAMALLQRIDIYGAKSYNTINSIVSLLMNQRINFLSPGPGNR
ncbi:heavy metal translocating P-type ATPase [Sporobacter termitidis]|uniref:heavy metal translocating P-type ATPase n=1 Tax=Sporobacter termitidis TaxID=44749 RepID=UPI001FA8F937|nr:HAD-IC family P-type ATPase [Sporobacter termitidis]